MSMSSSWEPVAMFPHMAKGTLQTRLSTFMGRYPGLSGCAQYNHNSPLRLVGDSERGM